MSDANGSGYEPDFDEASTSGTQMDDQSAIYGSAEKLLPSPLTVPDLESVSESSQPAVVPPGASPMPAELKRSPRSSQPVSDITVVNLNPASPVQLTSQTRTQTSQSPRVHLEDGFGEDGKRFEVSSNLSLPKGLAPDLRKFLYELLKDSNELAPSDSKESVLEEPSARGGPKYFRSPGGPVAARSRSQRPAESAPQCTQLLQIFDDVVGEIPKFYNTFLASVIDAHNAAVQRRAGVVTGINARARSAGRAGGTENTGVRLHQLATQTLRAAFTKTRMECLNRLKTRKQHAWTWCDKWARFQRRSDKIQSLCVELRNVADSVSKERFTAREREWAKERASMQEQIASLQQEVRDTHSQCQKQLETMASVYQEWCDKTEKEVATQLKEATEWKEWSQQQVRQATTSRMEESQAKQLTVSMVEEWKRDKLRTLAQTSMEKEHLREALASMRQSYNTLRTEHMRLREEHLDATHQLREQRRVMSAFESTLRQTKEQNRILRNKVTQLFLERREHVTQGQPGRTSTSVWGSGPVSWLQTESAQ